ncbi:nucleoside-diphosphate sugar epimerase/dehydratase [Marinomonas mediterranea]|uniref:nucleoside-diphosphate sugar epimerase/dehydratase n=1 Tax=Marinomonas mediterranea TaxID=119864 RepID=UPI00030B5263|nr:hypothetical protein [Marinomonas mediterranea]WCN16943.1 hypothetical protein GV053_07655 [Marinomonas mediterranea MMB-1]
MGIFQFIKKAITKTTHAHSSKKIIVNGVDYPSFNLASELLKTGCYNIIAFIDEEPWSNKTELLGTTLRYPSDIQALIYRYNVDAVIVFEKTPPIFSESLLREINDTKATLVSLNKTDTVTKHVSEVARKLTLSSI